MAGVLSDTEEDEEDGEEPERRVPRRGRSRRVRQHVNPLARIHQYEITLPPDWAQLHYPNPSQPFWIDIGSASGLFAVDAAMAHPERNILGLEIRDPATVKARGLQARRNVTNARFETCNVNIHFAQFAKALRGHGPIEAVFVQMPDPCFKKKHQPRRVMTPEFTAAVAAALMPGGVVFIQSDILPVAVSMRQELDACGGLIDITEEHTGLVQAEDRSWLAENPFGIPTRREMWVLAQGRPVYRALYRKQA